MWQGLDRGGFFGRNDGQTSGALGTCEGYEEGAGKHACMAAEVGLTIHMATVENYAGPGQKFGWSRDGSWVGPLGM